MMWLANLTFAAALCVIALGLGLWAMAALDSASRITGGARLMAGLLIGFLLLHFAIWAVGTWRYDRATMAATLLAAAVPAWLGLRRFDWAAAVQGVAALGDWARRDRSAAAALLLLVALVLAGILGGLAPPSDFDGLNYHLALGKFDLERGFIRPWDLNILGYFPALSEMLDRAALALTGPEAAQVVNGIVAAATAVLLATLARQGGASPGAALLAAILYLALRSVAWESGTSYVELMLAAYTLAAFAVLEVWRRASTPGIAVIFGLLIGGAINTKYHLSLIHI